MKFNIKILPCLSILIITCATQTMAMTVKHAQEIKEPCQHIQLCSICNQPIAPTLALVLSAHGSLHRTCLISCKNARIIATLPHYAVHIKTAEEDLGAALTLLRSGYFNSVMFHVQQCFEKSLKAYLAIDNEETIKTHDLGVLTNWCKQLDNTFNDFKAMAQQLNKFETHGRYADKYEIIDQREAQEAIIIAQRIIEFVCHKIIEYQQNI